MSPSPMAVSVNSSLRPRRRRPVTNDDFAAFVRRVVAAQGARVAQGDLDSLPELLAADRAVQTATRAAVSGLRSRGFSWTDIGAAAGVTRQAASQRWGGAL